MWIQIVASWTIWCGLSSSSYNIVHWRVLSGKHESSSSPSSKKWLQHWWEKMRWLRKISQVLLNCHIVVSFNCTHTCTHTYEMNLQQLSLCLIAARFFFPCSLPVMGTTPGAFSIGRYFWRFMSLWKVEFQNNSFLGLYLVDWLFSKECSLYFLSKI